MTEAPIHLLRGDLTDELYDAFRVEPRLAWDTETGGLDWRAEALGLVQVHAPGVATALVRPGPAVPERLASLLADSAVLKVLQYAPFDLCFMHSAWGVQSANVACTRMAAALLDPHGPEGSHSLITLLSRNLGVRISKDQQVTNWLADDLTPEQLAYAAGDVVHLLRLYDKQVADLTQAGLIDLYRASCAYLPTRVELEVRGFPDVFSRNEPWAGSSVGAGQVLPAQQPRMRAPGARPRSISPSTERASAESR